MKAQNLTVCVPFKGCDKDCEYCISKITPSAPFNRELFLRNAEKVVTLAKAGGVTSVLVTGKGEPCLNWPWLMKIGEIFQGWPLELQTNGIALESGRTDTASFTGKVLRLRELYEAGFNTIAISLDRLNQIARYSDLYRAIQYNDMTVRLTLNLTDLFFPERKRNVSMDMLISLCKQFDIHQLLLRNIIAPTYADTNHKVTKWIKTHQNLELYFQLAGETSGGILVRDLPEIRIYDYDGISVGCSFYCIEDKNRKNEIEQDIIRSLIYQEDGHLYTTWNSKASMLF